MVCSIPYIDFGKCGRPKTHIHVLFILYPSSELEELLVVPLRQRHSQPRCSGAARLWYHIQHMWSASQLPSGSDSYQDAGTRYEEKQLFNVSFCFVSNPLCCVTVLLFSQLP